jgi:glycosyltransferase involved in cell wall biosynthesis
MNVCLVSQEYPPETARGGIGTQTWDKARELARLGHSVHVLSSSAGRELKPRTAVEDRVTVHRMPALCLESGQDVPIYNDAAYWLGYTWSVFRYLHGLMQKTAFDVIDFAEYGAEGFAYQLNRGTWNWAPVVVHLHGSLGSLAQHVGWPEEDSDFHRVGTFMEGVSIQLADGLMSCSACTAEFTSRFYRVSRQLIDVVYCSVDTQAFRPGPEAERAADQPTVLFVGNIAKNKGVQTVFEAVLRLRRKYPRIRLQILGRGDDDLEDQLRRRSRAEGTGLNVEFHGFTGRERLPELYRRADVFCLPSQYEAFGLVYLEAMACGCPVVASAAGGGPEAVLDGETGIVVPPGDAGAVVQALDLLLGDAPLRRRMGAAGRKRVEQNFTMESYILRVLAAYANAIEASRQKLHRSRETALAAEGYPK